MCGIALALDLAGRGRARSWALPLMQHRGPDGSGSFTSPDGMVSLEHCRLAIIDPDNPKADQPFGGASGRRRLIYNGEIFNFRELRSQLESEGASFATDSDTEVLFRGLDRHGTKFLADIRGMFAFALWDEDNRELIAARDHVGVKPLYYAEVNGMLVLASEVRTLLAHPAVAHTIDPSGLVEHLAFGYCPSERTLVQGVKKLPPGHYLRATPTGVVIDEYWDPLPVEDDLVDPTTATEQLRELLDGSVRASLVSDVPVGMMLSAGLDSSTIAVMAARAINPQDLTAYSISFGLPTDEAAAAGTTASALGIHHRTIHLSPERVGADFDMWLDTVDLPTADPTWLAISQICRAAHDDGIKVLLSGDGGDELFGGYSRWMKYLRFHDAVWRQTPHGLRSALGRALAAPLGGLAGDVARRAGAGGELFVGSRPFHDDLLQACLGKRGREAASLSPPEAPIEAHRGRYLQRHPSGDYLSWMSYVSLKTHLVEDYLARLDKMGMLHSVEGRVPLLDPTLVRWAFRVPQALMVGGYRQKALFRRAVGPDLPIGILERPKQGFCPPITGWARELLAKRTTNLNPALTETGLVARDALHSVARGNGAKNSFAYWSLATLSAWADKNL